MEFAKNNAWLIGKKFYKTKNKVPMTRTTFSDCNTMSYLLGKRNAAADALELLEQNLPETKEGGLELMELLIGDYQIELLKIWNDEIMKTEIGKMTFRRMTLEDIIEKRPIENFIQNPQRVTVAKAM